MAVMTLSPVLQRVIRERIGWERCRKDRREFAALCRGVSELSVLFTKGRAGLIEDYLAETRLRTAYVAYFLPVNAAKIQVLLSELPRRDPERPLKVLDLGSGPGTTPLAVLDWLQSAPGGGGTGVHVQAVDRSLRALDEAERLWDEYRRLVPLPDARLTSLQADVRKPAWIPAIASERFDLIVLANTLNECASLAHDPVASQLALLQRLLLHLDDRGTLLIVEPALRDAARHLHGLRNAVLAVARVNVYSPCLHERPCPALTREEDWCHEERPWLPPPWIAAIDREVGFIKDALKFSYLALRKDGLTVVPRAPDLYRVVSELRVLKGDQRAWLCNEQGRSDVGRLNRARSPENHVMDAWHRGAIVRLGEVEWKATGDTQRAGRIGSTTAVGIVRPVD
ncbi:small ribosomal subunit Rsm22 family protein [Candidatus Nitrospira bockiana]